MSSVAEEMVGGSRSHNCSFAPVCPVCTNKAAVPEAYRAGCSRSRNPGIGPESAAIKVMMRPFESFRSVEKKQRTTISCQGLATYRGGSTPHAHARPGCRITNCVHTCAGISLLQIRAQWSGPPAATQTSGVGSARLPL